MASNIPKRRTTGATRTATARDTENANARPSRIFTNAKPLTSTSTVTATGLPTAGGTTRATAATAASKAKIAGDSKADPAAGKRKREALGEIPTTHNKAKPTAAKGKESVKEKFDGVVLKAKATTTTTTARQPLQTVATTRRNGKTATVPPPAQVAKPEPEPIKLSSDHAMAIDPPPIPSLTVRRSLVKEEVAPPPRRETRRSDAHRRALEKQQAEEDEEAKRVFKKRRTSSEAPEDPRVAEETLLAAEEDAIAARIAAELEAFADEPEADPEKSGWEDLDADDADDPLMVSEYVVDIFNYLKKTELTTLASPDYMERQKELAWSMRGILIDWLIQVHVRSRLLPETLYLCVNIIDRFLSARVVSLAKLQLVGVTAMFVAAKFEEIMAPSVTYFLTCTDASYTESEIFQAERYILKTLDWNLSYPNPCHFLRRTSKADDYNVHVRTLAKYLLEVACLEWRLIAAPPSLTAAASIWLARMAIGLDHWTPNLAHYSSYPESALVPTANLILNYIVRPIRHPSFHRKYAGKRYFKASVYMREWALERWEADSYISLEQDLPKLKAQIRIERQNAEARLAQEEEDEEAAAAIAAAAVAEAEATLVMEAAAAAAAAAAGSQQRGSASGSTRLRRETGQTKGAGSVRALPTGGSRR